MSGYRADRRAPRARGRRHRSGAGRRACSPRRCCGCFYAGDTPAMLAAGRARGRARRAGARRARARFFAAMAQGMALVADGAGRGGRGGGPRGGRDARAIATSCATTRALLVWAAFGPLWLREADAGRALIDAALRRARARRPRSARCRSLLHHLAPRPGDDRPLAGRGGQLRRGDPAGARDRPARRARGRARRARLARGAPGARGGVPRARGRGARAVRRARPAALRRLGDRRRSATSSSGSARPAASRSSTTRRRRGAARARRSPTSTSRPAPELVEPTCGSGAARTPQRGRRPSFAARGRGQGPAVGAGPRARAAAALVAEPDDGWSALFERGARAARADARRLRDRAHAARLRRAPAPRAPARARPRAAARGARGVRAARRAVRGPTRPSAELAATGETARRRDAEHARRRSRRRSCRSPGCSPSGRTTREAAAAIFLSPKTVEYHLRHVYRKLGIHSREELAGALRWRRLKATLWVGSVSATPGTVPTVAPGASPVTQGSVPSVTRDRFARKASVATSRSS